MKGRVNSSGYALEGHACACPLCVVCCLLPATNRERGKERTCVMLLLIAWVLYVACAVWCMVWPIRSAGLLLRAIEEKRYYTIGICVLVSVMCQIVMMCEYGFWRMLGIQALVGLASGIRSFIAHRRYM